MAAEIKIEPQASTQQLQTVQIDGTQQYYFIQSNGSDSTNQHAEYILSNVGDLGENTIIMFEEEGVGAEETVSSEEYVTYVVPQKDGKTEYNILEQYREIPYTETTGAFEKYEIRDAIANIGAIDCKEEVVEETQTGIVHHENGDVHFEIKSEVHYGDEGNTTNVYVTPEGTRIFRQSAEQPLNLVKKEKPKTSNVYRGNADLITCKLCNSYVVASKIEAHNRDVHANNPQLVCPDCGKLFTSKRSLVGHKKEKHSGPLEIFPCSECGKNFSRRSNLKAHMDSIHYGKKFPCSFCDRIFTNRSCMNLHVKKTHSDILSM